MTHKARYVPLTLLAVLTVLLAVCAQPAFAAAREESAPSPSEALESQRQAALRASCQNNLKQLGIVMKMFANEKSGFYPKLQERPGRLMFRHEEIYPEFLTSPQVLVCPATRKDNQEMPDPSENIAWYFEGRDYWYLGYAMMNEEQGLDFLKAYREEATTGDKRITDNDLPGGHGMPIRRLREGVERFFVTDISDPDSAWLAQSTIPTMIERPGHHEGGANVLFMDGHVESMKYPGEWPMTEKFIKGLQSLDKLKKPPEEDDTEPASEARR